MRLRDARETHAHSHASARPWRVLPTTRLACRSGRSPSTAPRPSWWRGAAAVPLPARRGALPQRARPQRAPAALSSLSCGGEIRRDRPQIGARLGAAQPVDKRRCERRLFTAPAVNYRRSTSLSREPSRTSTRGAPITPRPQTHCGPTRRPLEMTSPPYPHTPVPDPRSRDMCMHMHVCIGCNYAT